MSVASTALSELSIGAGTDPAVRPRPPRTREIRPLSDSRHLPEQR